MWGHGWCGERHRRAGCAVPVSYTHLYGDDEPEEDASDTPRASGSSFDEIDDACKTAKNPDATQAEREKAAKEFTDMEGTELYEKMMEGSSEIGIRIKGLIEMCIRDRAWGLDVAGYQAKDAGQVLAALEQKKLVVVLMWPCLLYTSRCV